MTIPNTLNIDKPIIKIKHDGSISYATGKSRKETQWKNKNILWSALVEKLSHTIRTPETYAEYMKLSKTDRDNIKDVGGFVGGSLKNGRRKAENVANRTLLTLDLDYVVGDVWSSIEILWDFGCLMYSTHTHAPDNQRLRIVIPLSRPVLPDEYQAIARMIASDLGMDMFDDTTYEPSRLMYSPSTSCDGEYIFKFQDEAWLNPDDVLSRYTFGWQDVSYWPESSRARAKITSAIKKQEDPLLKENIVGDFCRTYSISEAIAEFLGDVYTPGTDETRYTFTGGSTSGGVVIYEDKFSFSHHGTDPTSGLTVNAFDLVRIHKFGELDELAEEVGPKEHKKSYLAMAEFAVKDEKVMRSILENDFESVANNNNTQIKYIAINRNGQKVINTGLLAKHIRLNYHYMVVRKQGYDNDFLYWFDEGYYKKSSPNEFKGRIKSFIPENIRKPNQWEETYRDLLTDVASVGYELLDTNEDYINLKNGLYNIKTRSLEPHKPEIKTTIQLNCKYDIDAPEPKEWIKFINTLSNNDKEVVAILQEWFGIALSNIDMSKLKKCMALYGAVGDTGKTQYTNLLIHMLGVEFISAVPIQDLSKSFATSNLYGKRMVAVDDQSSINIEDSSVFKSITGGGVIQVEFKGKPAFPYHYRGGVLFCCNDLPYIKDDKGDHVYNRMMIIPCNNVIPKELQIKGIVEKFKNESEGIFLWALEGLNRLIANNFTFTTSVVSENAKDEYKKMNDTVYKFLREDYIITENKKDKIKKTDFEDSYNLWKVTDNENTGVEKKNVKNRMAKHGIALVEYGHVFYYVGIKKIDKPKEKGFLE
jgi:P4 family phage/plasmid primase-like protien